MYTQHKKMRSYRKRSRLTQADIGFLLQLPESSSISRWELGQRQAPPDISLAYHLLFEMPIDSLFEQNAGSVSDVLKGRIKLLIEQLEQQETSQKVRGRIAFLEATLARLGA
jgi:transcriptional regulator with XRE-family HTH domain